VGFDGLRLPPTRVPWFGQVLVFRRCSFLEVCMRKFLIAASATVVVGLATAGCAGDGPVRPDVTPPSYDRSSTSQDLARVKRVGEPIWRPVDFHLFTAAIGTLESGFAEFSGLIERLLPPPNHIPLPPVFGVGPAPRTSRHTIANLRRA
jgi:hypothetical protein